MQNIFNKLKLKLIINTSNAKFLTREKIKEITFNFSKAEVLKHKKSILFKLIEKSARTIEKNKELKQIATEFKLVFNIKINKKLKQHLIESKQLSSKLQPIDFFDFKLLKNEEVYLKLNNGFFFDIPHIKKFDYKLYKYLLVTNKRLIMVFPQHKNSYYYNKYKFKNAIKFVLIKDKSENKPGIFLYSKNNTKLLTFLEKFKGQE